jgi:hypothetical protein
LLCGTGIEPIRIGLPSTLLLSGRPNSRLLCIILQPGKCVQDTQQGEARAYKARGFCYRGRVDASGHEIWSGLRGRRLLRAAALVAFFHPYFFAVRLAANACGACRRGGASLLAQVWSLRGNSTVRHLLSGYALILSAAPSLFTVYAPGRPRNDLHAFDNSLRRAARHWTPWSG